MSKVVILTGLSGAGKSTALFAFEEMDYYVIENVPEPLLEQLFKLINSGDERYQNAVISVNLGDALTAIKIARRQPGLQVTVLGLLASVEELLSRFKLTRHVHPLQIKGMTLPQALNDDLEKFKHIRYEIDVLIDTTNLKPAAFRKKIFAAFKQTPNAELTISFVSFGYKYGVPSDVDLIVDTRILPNPFWVLELKNKTGNNKDVVKYVFENEIGPEFLQNAEKYIDYYLQIFAKESRPHYVVGIGCTGGQHRSVAVAQYLKEKFSTNYKVLLTHRDLVRQPPTSDEQ
jgi:RNase adapter protein RapZ